MDIPRFIYRLNTFLVYGWNEGITNAIAYIEENLTDDIDVNKIADKANVSSFYFQKIFNVLCGFTMEGGTMLEYKIVEKAQFTVMGKSRKFNTETSYGEIPKFWKEHMESGESKVVCGMYGICMDGDGKNFDYFIADNYIPWNGIPEGYETKVIPAGTWAIFPCRGALPKALQDVNTKIWSEWLPSCKAYKLAGNYNIEMYTPPCEDPEDNYNEIWIPVEKA